MARSLLLETNAILGFQPRTSGRDDNFTNYQRSRETPVVPAFGLIMALLAENQQPLK